VAQRPAAAARRRRGYRGRASPRQYRVGASGTRA
jgi:hypothetical protein